MSYTTIGSWELNQTWPTDYGASGTLAIWCSQNFVADDGKEFLSGSGESLTGEFVTKVNITVTGGVGTVASFSLPATDLASPQNVVRYSARIFDANGAARDSWPFESFHLKSVLGTSISFLAWQNNNQTPVLPQPDGSPTVAQMNTAIAAADAPLGATYITQTPDSILTNEQALSSLSTGLMRVTTLTGVVTSLADSTAGYYLALNSSGVPAYVPHVFNVKSYGATGDGSTNDTTAIQAAITACGAAGGGIVYFPAGTYKVTALTVASDNVRLVGVGRASRIAKSTATGVTLTFDNGLSGSSLATFLQGTGVQGIKFEPLVTRTSGAEIYAPHTHGFELDDLYFLNVYQGLLLGRASDLNADTHLTRIRMYGFTIGMKFINALDVFGDGWSLDINSSTAIARGVWLSGGCEAFAVTNFDVVNSAAPDGVGAGSYTLYVKNDAGTSTPARFNKFSNGYFDGGATGAWLEDGEDNEFISVWFHGYVDAGLIITGNAANTKVIGGGANRCGTDGIFVNTTGRGTVFNNVWSINNKNGGAGGHGFDLSTGASYVTLDNCRAGIVTSIIANGTQQYGLNIEAGVNNVKAINCDFTTNNIGAYNILSTDKTNVFRDNTTEWGVGDYVRSTYNGVAQSIPTGTGSNTPLTFDTNVENPNSMHSTSSNPTFFIGLTPSVFVARCTIQFEANAVGFRQLAVIRYNPDGSGATTIDFVKTQSALSATIPTVMSINTDVFMTYGQFIKFEVQQNAGVALNVETVSGITPRASLIKQ